LEPIFNVRLALAKKFVWMYISNIFGLINPICSKGKQDFKNRSMGEAYLSTITT
jgi:hypothetical protein